MKKILILFTFIISLLLVGCNTNETVKSITMKDNNIYSYVDDFNYNDVMVIVEHTDGSIEEIPFSENMLSTSNKNLLDKVGTHNLTVKYNSRTTDLKVTVREKPENIVDFQVDFELDGGYISPKLEEVQNEPLLIPYATKSGYIFLGWYVDSNLTQKFVSSNAYDNLTLYAKWKANNLETLDEFFYAIEYDSYTLDYKSSSDDYQPHYIANTTVRKDARIYHITELIDEVPFEESYFIKSDFEFIIHKWDGGWGPITLNISVENLLRKFDLLNFKNYGTFIEDEDNVFHFEFLEEKQDDFYKKIYGQNIFDDLEESEIDSYEISFDLNVDLNLKKITIINLIIVEKDSVKFPIGTSYEYVYSNFFEDFVIPSNISQEVLSSDLKDIFTTYFDYSEYYTAASIAACKYELDKYANEIDTATDPGLITDIYVEARNFLANYPFVKK